MNIPPDAFIHNNRRLPHMRDDRRPIGRFQTGGREDGTGYQNQTVQLPVICAVDIVERRTGAGRDEDYVTSNPHRVRCPDCKARLT